VHRAVRARLPGRILHLLRAAASARDRGGARGGLLVNALVTLHQENWGVYGVRKLWHAGRRAGLEVGRDQVGRLMGIAGIQGAVRGRHRTVATRGNKEAPRHADLVKRGWNTPTSTDQLWAADFS